MKHKFGQKNGKLVSFASREELEFQRAKDLRRMGDPIDILFSPLMESKSKIEPFLASGELDDDLNEEAENALSKIYDLALNASKVDFEDILSRLDLLYTKASSDFSQKVYSLLMNLVDNKEDFSASGLSNNVSGRLFDHFMEQRRLRPVASDDSYVIANSEFGPVIVDRETFGIEDSSLGDSFEDDSGENYFVREGYSDGDLRSGLSWTIEGEYQGEHGYDE